MISADAPAVPECLTPARFLTRGLGLPLPAASAQTVPSGHSCPLTGESLSQGYAAHDIIPDTTGNVLDLLGADPHGFLSVDAASALKGDYNLGHRAFFAGPDGQIDALYPRLAPETDKARLVRQERDADKEARREAGTLHWKQAAGDGRDGSLPRPLWRDLVRDIWPARQGQPCLLLVATDYKRRVWHRARVGPLGGQTPVLLFDPSRDVFKSARLDWPRLLDILTLVEQIYTAGFSKAALARSLYAETKAVAAVGTAQTLAWEKQIAPLRDADEFTLAAIIAQKTVPPKPSDAESQSDAGSRSDSQEAELST